MDSKDQLINALKKQVRELKKENDYLKSPLYLFELTQVIQGNYSVLLNPPHKYFSTTKNQKACDFKLDLNDIICIKSNGKIKWIYFSKKQESISGEKLISDKLHFTGTITSFCKKYDPPKIHLCIVSRSVAVNPAYYYLNSNKLILLGKINPYNLCDKISITPRFVEGFIEQKATLDHINSFQKIQIRSK